MVSPLVYTVLADGTGEYEGLDGLSVTVNLLPFDVVPETKVTGEISDEDT
jgi:hypothetical protein